MLHGLGIELQAKGIAVGVRLEHPQELIDRLQYHSPQGRGKYLPAAEYSMLTRVDDRAVYSFCMCPGGYIIIPAASAPGQLVVNGMSPANRGTRMGQLRHGGGNPTRRRKPSRQPRRTENDEIPGRNRNMLSSRPPAKPAQAPAQRMDDFVAAATVPTSRAPRTLPGVLPRPHRPSAASFVAAFDRPPQRAFAEFGRKQRGFLCHDAVLIGDETRTSSPVRIPRDPTSLLHISTPDSFLAAKAPDMPEESFQRQSTVCVKSTRRGLGQYSAQGLASIKAITITSTKSCRKNLVVEIKILSNFASANGGIAQLVRERRIHRPGGHEFNSRSRY